MGGMVEKLVPEETEEQTRTPPWNWQTQKWLKENNNQPIPVRQKETYSSRATKIHLCVNGYKGGL